MCIPNCTFFVRFGGISGKFGRAVVCVLVRRTRAKILKAKQRQLDMSLKRTDYVFITPKFGRVSMISEPYQVSDIDIVEYQDSRHGC